MVNLQEKKLIIVKSTKEETNPLLTKISTNWLMVIISRKEKKEKTPNWEKEGFVPFRPLSVSGANQRHKGDREREPPRKDILNGAEP